MVRKTSGQILVLFAHLVPCLAIFFLFALGVASVLDVRAHAADSLGTATRAAARQIEYESCSTGLRFNEEAVTTAVKMVFQQALSLRPGGLAVPPDQIADQVQVLVGYGSPSARWISPFVPGRFHDYPTVAAQARVPVRVWGLELTLTIVSETEVR
jgi:hypothetical protein